MLCAHCVHVGVCVRVRACCVRDECVLCAYCVHIVCMLRACCVRMQAWCVYVCLLFVMCEVCVVRSRWGRKAMPS